MKARAGEDRMRMNELHLDAFQFPCQTDSLIEIQMEQRRKEILYWKHKQGILIK